MDTQYSPLNVMPPNEKPVDGGDEARLIDGDSTVLPLSREDATSLDNDKCRSAFPNNPRMRCFVKKSSKTKIGPTLPWSCLRLWWLEVVASFAVLLSLIALSALLGLYSGKPRSEWPYFLSINAIVAALVTVLRVAVLFIAVEGKGSIRFKQSELNAVQVSVNSNGHFTWIRNLFIL